MVNVNIELKYPIQLAGVPVKVLRMRRPKVIDMLALDSAGSESQKEVRLFANLCELPTEAIQELDLADYQSMQKAYQGFLS